MEQEFMSNKITPEKSKYGTTNGKNDFSDHK
jgi:hypothetical protein